MREYNCDLHFHGPYSGGVSKNMLIPIIAEQTKLKGLDIVGTADILHKKWFEHVKENLVEETNGIYSSKKNGMNFIVQTEVQDMQRVHHLVFLPDLSSALNLKESLSGKAVFDSMGCGRPIIRLNAEQIAEKVADANGIIGPAHAFTPYFSVYAHFDSLKKLYGRMWENIYFIELGLSADSYFADLIEENHNYQFITASDSHCVHPNTVIYLEDGQIIPIKKIHNPLRTLSIDFEKDLKQDISIPFKLTKKPSPKKMYKISLRTKEIIVTPEHRFFILENGEIKEKYASKLKEGDLVATLNKLKFGKFSQELPKPKIDYFFIINSAGLNYLKKKREERRLLQRDVAEYLNIHGDYVWRLEKGNHRINEKYLMQLFALYKIEPQEFTVKFKIKKTPTIKFPSYTNVRFCQILGYLLGDGGTKIGKKGRQLGLYDKNKKLLERYCKLIEQEFNVKRTITKKSGEESFRLRYPAAILDFINLVSPDLITYSTKRKIPSLAYKLPKIETAAFLRGLFDAEGCVGHHNIDICSSNLFLLKQVQTLLLKFGINSYLYRDLLEKTKQKYRHRLFIYGQQSLKLFLKHVGFSSIPKQEKLKKYLSSLKQKEKDSYVDYLPLLNSVKEIITKLNIKQKSFPKTLNGFFYSKKRKIRRRNLRQMVLIIEKQINRMKIKNPEVIEKLRKLKLFVESDISWQPINKNEIIKANCKYVYDLTIPGYENYVAEGIIVHNSPWPYRIGREFTRMNLKEPSFKEIKKALEKKEEKLITLNVGLDPREGKYHCTACNNCFVKYSPREALQFKWKCIKCGGTIKKGVRDRITELAKFKEEIHPEFRPRYIHCLPLAEIIQSAVGVKDVKSQQVQSIWKDFVERFDNEVNALIDVKVEELATVNEMVARKVEAFRNGWVLYIPGGGGNYGKPLIFNSEDELKRKKEEMKRELSGESEFKGQKTLMEY